MIDVFIVGVVFYGAVLVVMYAGQRKLQYAPDNNVPSREKSGLTDMDEVRFETEDALVLFAWAATPREAQKPWVVIFHGNAGTIATRDFKARVFLQAGYGVLLGPVDN